MPKVKFDPDKFTRVTEVLRGAGLIDLTPIRPDVLERAQKFGTAVHKATELDDKNDLAMDTVDAPLIPYLEAWKKFKADYKVSFKPEEIEQPVYSLRWKFKGTPDRWPIYINNKLILLDIKSTTTIMPSVAIQMAAYQIAWEEMTKQRIKERWCIQLTPDGYKIEPYKNESDKSVFLAALTVYNFRKERGLLKNA